MKSASLPVLLVQENDHSQSVGRDVRLAQGASSLRRLLALLTLIVLATDGLASVQRQLEGMGPGAWFAVVYLALAAALFSGSRFRAGAGSLRW